MLRISNRLIKSELNKLEFYESSFFFINPEIEVIDNPKINATKSDIRLIDMSLNNSNL